MNLTPEQLAELKALAEAATPGPWRIGALESYDGYSGKPYRNVWQGQDDEARIIARAILDQGNEQTDVDADASFIAAAREAIPALIADLKESNARIADLENGHTNVDAEYARQFDTNAAVESSKAQRELAATRKQLEEAQAKLAAAEKEDPLQGAANWLCEAMSNCDVADIQSNLLIGFNRAKRLFDAAIDAQEGK